MYTEITLEIEDPAAVITLNRPESLNALTYRTIAEFRHAIAAAEADDRVVGIIITGAGRGFCAGMDMNALSEMTATGETGGGDFGLHARPGDPAMGENFHHGFTWLMTVRKPVISAINGACAGLGFSIACLTDLRFVERQAKFTTAFSQRGLVAEHGVSWVLPRLIGTGRALDLLWTSRRFDGEEALALGIADRLTETGQAVEDARQYIRELAASASPTSLMEMKQQLYRHLNMSLGESMLETDRMMAASLKRPDFTEGVNSFLERRAPSFQRISGP